MTNETCDRCGHTLTAEALAMGWPVAMDDEYICPACYGDEAYCGQGHVLRACDESSACQRCATAAAAILGRRGGRANSPAQQAQRAQPKPGAGRPKRDPYGNRYHRDGTVTYWSVYEQQWRRAEASVISAETLATMTASERDRIARHAERS